MDDNFEPLDPDEVLSVEEPYVYEEPFFYLAYTFKTGEVTEKIKEFLMHCDNTSCCRQERQRLFGEGIEGEVLRFGAKGWQKGKFRVRFIVEFCPDEPEVEETPPSNEPESPLDDIRRMIREENQ